MQVGEIEIDASSSVADKRAASDNRFRRCETVQPAQGTQAERSE